MSASSAMHEDLGQAGEREASITRSLLACGIVGGPLFVAVVVIEAFTRTGFDLNKHVLSLLSNGDAGWIQIANFVLTGILMFAAAIGLRRALRSAPGGRLLPGLLTGWAAGLVVAGVCVADPAYGFPVGAPPGRPDTISLHGALHGAGFAVSFLMLIAACFVTARRAHGIGDRKWAIYSTVTGVALIAAIGGLLGAGINILALIATIVAVTWMAATLARIRARVSSPPRR